MLPQRWPNWGTDDEAHSARGRRCNLAGVLRHSAFAECHPLTTQAEREERERIVWNEAIETAAKVGSDAVIAHWTSGKHLSVGDYAASVFQAVEGLMRGEHRKDKP